MKNDSKMNNIKCMFLLMLADNIILDQDSIIFELTKELANRVCVAIPTEVWLKEKGISVFQDYKARYSNLKKFSQIDMIYVFDTDYQLTQYKEKENPDCYKDIIQIP